MFFLGDGGCFSGLRARVSSGFLPSFKNKSNPIFAAKIFPTGSQMLRPSPAVMVCVFSNSRHSSRNAKKMFKNAVSQQLPEILADGVQTLPIMFSLNLMRRQASSFWLRTLFGVWISFRWVLPRALG